MEVASVPRPDAAAYERSIRAPFAEIAGELRAILGTRLVAFLGEVKAGRTVADWAQGKHTPGEAVEERLRLAYRIAATIAEAEGPEVARLWMSGANPHLNEVSPARALREGDPQETSAELIGLARSFAFHG